MERRLWFFVTPFALLTLIFGVALIYSYGMDWFRQAGWLHVKLTLVMPIYAYHFYLFKLVRDFAQDKNTHSSRFYRFLNEAPVLVLLAVIILAVVKPLF
jgi:putative membrane protein